MTKIIFLLTISIYCQEKWLWELIKWSLKRKCFDLLSKISQLILQGNVWRSVSRICKCILGLKELKNVSYLGPCPVGKWGWKVTSPALKSMCIYCGRSDVTCGSPNYYECFSDQVHICLLFQVQEIEDELNKKGRGIKHTRKVLLCKVILSLTWTVQQYTFQCYYIYKFFKPTPPLLDSNCRHFMSNHLFYLS